MSATIREAIKNLVKIFKQIHGIKGGICSNRPPITSDSVYYYLCIVGIICHKIKTETIVKLISKKLFILFQKLGNFNITNIFVLTFDVFYSIFKRRNIVLL